MNILFLTLVQFESLNDNNIYTDLLREFVKNGHSVAVVSPVEKRQKQKTHLNIEKNAKILRLQIGDIHKTNKLRKGISTLLIEPTVKKALKKYFALEKFDLILYSTPPITFVSAVRFIKKRDAAKSYLLLKDIFPQNAVDLGMMSTSGISKFIYNHFRKQEKKLYDVSDYIGCMSQANIDYVIKHNPEINIKTVETCPNSIDPIDKSVDEKTKIQIRKQYGIPIDKKVFLYGGNLGKPQGIPFVIECLKKCKDISNAFFLIIGDGTEYKLLDDYAKYSQQNNLKLMKRLPKQDYDNLVGACDIGLIFLDYRFTIPNFPSRLLAYMQAKIPVLACTDPTTDIGKIITEGGFGWQCRSNDSDGFVNTIHSIINADLSDARDAEYQFLLDHYDVRNAYCTISAHF